MDDIRKRVLMLVAPKGFFEPEYTAPRAVFSEEGLDVSVATAGKEATGTQGTIIKVDLDVAQADVKDFDALFVAGGKGMMEFSKDKSAQRLLRKFVRAGKPVAMICHGPLLAAEAKVAAGRQVTGWPEIRAEIVAAGGQWTGMPVERDGDLFTAVGPQDAETLAYVLAKRLAGSTILSKTQLDKVAAMRKLALLWQFADSIRGPLSEAEAERLLREFESQGVEEKEPMVLGPSALSAAPVPLPVPRTTTPGTRQQRQRQPGEWNIAVTLHAPAIDGSWPSVPEAPPPGFPFAAQDLEDGPSIRALFQKRETWEALKEMMANPSKQGLIQSYLLPKILLSVGKDWWDKNKRRKSLGDAPFGLFSQEEYLKYRDEPNGLDGTVAGRAFIAIINQHVADILQKYLTYKGSEGHLDGYIYDSLTRRMMADAGRRHGFEPKQKPTCIYCRTQRNIETTPPVLSETDVHQTSEGKRRHPLYTCPTCADLIETKEQELRLREQNVLNVEESLRSLDGNIKDVEEQLGRNPNNKDLTNRLETLREQRKTGVPQLESLVGERDKLRADVENRRRMTNVPYNHLMCANPNCPGGTIPLTFVDWQDAFWGMPEGAAARQKLSSAYGIVEKPEQRAEDTAEGQISETVGRMPPEWMWDIPFRCPFDGWRFTPRAAFGNGKKDPGGKAMGGLFVNPPRTTIWWKPQSLEPADPEAEHTRVEEVRKQTGVGETTDSDTFLSDQNEKMYYEELSSSLRQELYRRKLEHAKRTGGLEGNDEAQREALLHDAVLEWSYTHPLHLVGYFVQRMPSSRRVFDPQTGEVRKHLEIRSLNRGDAEQITSSLIQTWFSKFLERKNGWDLMQRWLTNMRQDHVPPRCYFLTVAEHSGDHVEARCGLRYGKGSPLGEKSPRGKTYEKQGKSPYMALVEGIWDYDGQPDANQIAMPIPVEKGDALVSGKTNHINDMEEHNSRRIVFDSASSVREGAPLLVRAIFMPRHTGWRPMQRILDLRKDLKDPEDEMTGIMGALGRLADENENDTRLVSIWRKSLRKLNMPEQLKQFDEGLRKKLEEGGRMEKRESLIGTLVAEAKDPCRPTRASANSTRHPSRKARRRRAATSTASLSNYTTRRRRGITTTCDWRMTTGRCPPGASQNTGCPRARRNSWPSRPRIIRSST